MSTENAPEAPAEKPAGHNPLKDKALEIKEVPEVLDFLRENGISILVGAGVAAAVFLGWSLYRNLQTSQRETAAAQIFNAQTPEQIQQVVTEYPKTPAASLAQLILAGQAFDQGQYEMAHNLFAQFIEQHPDHELRDNATLGIVQCTEASGRYTEALDGYTRFIAEHPGHYLEPTATFGKARCLELLGRFEDAQAVYEGFIAGRDEDDNWRNRAESALAMLKKDMRAQARGEKVQLLETATPAFNFPALQQAAPTLPTPTAP